MQDKDAFFSFNDFEHCQDSFFGWLFNNYRNNSPLSQRIAIRILTFFCDLDFDSLLGEIKRLKAIPQPSKKVIADLLITFEYKTQHYAIFIEDKTKSSYSFSQVKKMVSCMADYSFDYGFDCPNENRFYGFISTNSSEVEIKTEVEGCKYILRTHLLHIFDCEYSEEDREEEKNNKDSKHDWLLDSFYAYLKGRCLSLDIYTVNNLVFENAVKEVLGEKQNSLSFHYGTGGQYPSPEGYVTEAVISPPNNKCNYKLVIHAKKKSKNHVLIRIFSSDLVKNEAIEKRFIEALSIKRPFEKYKCANHRYAALDHTFWNIEELGERLDVIFENYFACINEIVKE